MKNKINHIHEKALKLAYSDHVSSFDDLLQKDRLFIVTTGTFKVQLLKFASFSRSFSKYHEKCFPS